MTRIDKHGREVVDLDANTVRGYQDSLIRAHEHLRGEERRFTNDMRGVLERAVDNCKPATLTVKQHAWLKRIMTKLEKESS